MIFLDFFYYVNNFRLVLKKVLLNFYNFIYSFKIFYTVDYIYCGLYV